jgi:hypothetical protein
MSDTESDRDSLEFINDYDGERNVPEEEVERLNTVRDAIKNWKQREMDKNTLKENESKGLSSLRNYVSKSSELYYDLNTFLKTSKNNEKNMKDSLYVNIVSSIGNPGSLTSHLRTLLNHYLERDLVELPFTLETNMINSQAEKGNRAQTDFPEEE